MKNYQENCIFCKIINGELPSYKIYENEYVLAFLDINPNNIGHTLVIPKEHFENTLNTPDEQLQKIVVATKKISKAILSAVNANSCNIIMNNGATAGQIIFHTHWHIIPRFENDGHKLWSAKKYKEGEADKVLKKIKLSI